jgi:hypothetical protein
MCSEQESGGFTDADTGAIFYFYGPCGDGVIGDMNDTGGNSVTVTATAPPDFIWSDSGAILNDGMSGSGIGGGAGGGGTASTGTMMRGSDSSLIDWERVGSCVVDSTLNHYGFTAAAVGSGTLAIPIPKSLVPPYRVIGERTTNLLSVLGHYVEINVPRIAIDGLASTNLLRIAGRVNPYVAGALFAIDVGMISYDTFQCYKNQ